MKKIILSLALSAAALTFSSSAFANLDSYIWAYDINHVLACYPSNDLGQVAMGSVSVNLQYCQFSYAWGRDYNNNITCFPVGVNGQFVPGMPPAAPASCAKAYIWSMDNQGVVECFGQGPDGNTLVNSFSVDPSFCNN